MQLRSQQLLNCSAAWAMGLGQQAQVCILSAEQEQGPFYIKDEMLRSNVAENKPGLPLALRIAVILFEIEEDLGEAGLFFGGREDGLIDNLDSQARRRRLRHVSS